MLSGGDTGNRLAEVDEVLGCLVVQTVEHHEAELEVSCCGRLFQTRAAATGRARWPMADSHVRRTISDDDETERVGDAEPRSLPAG